MKKGDEPIIVEQDFNVSADTVWRAITELEQMRQWYFHTIPSFKPEVGFQTQFTVQGPERNFLHLWEIAEVIPHRKISYKWKYDGIPGDSLVEFELFIQQNITRLRVTHHVLESFPEDIPEFKRESGTAGWTFFIKESLRDFLEKLAL
jgi:uncharacterized protein YndB with AHSA1/START domain